MVDQMGRGVGHAPAPARGAEAATLARERHEGVAPAGCAVHAHEAVSQEAALEKAAQLAPAEEGQAEARVSVELGQKGLEVVAHELVEERRLRRTPAVAGEAGFSGSAGHTPRTGPGRAGLRRGPRQEQPPLRKTQRRLLPIEILSPSRRRSFSSEELPLHRRTRSTGAFTARHRVHSAGALRTGRSESAPHGRPNPRSLPNEESTEPGWAQSSLESGGGGRTRTDPSDRSCDRSNGDTSQVRILFPRNETRPAARRAAGLVEW